MKSNIDSEQVKKIIIRTVEKAIAECANQLKYNLEDGDPMNKTDWASHYEIDPAQLILTFDFRFNNLIGNKRGRIICAPTIDLTRLEIEGD